MATTATTPRSSRRSPRSTRFTSTLNRTLIAIGEHPIWSAVLAIATVISIIVGMQRGGPNPPVCSVEPEFSSFGFPAENDRRLQQDREDLYKELCATLDSSPVRGTSEVVHASFIANHNLMDSVLPSDEFKSAHAEETQLLGDQLEQLLAVYEINEFTADVHGAIAIGTSNMMSKYRQ